MVLRKNTLSKIYVYRKETLNGGLVIWFNDISTHDGYLISNPVYISSSSSSRCAASMDFPHTICFYHPSLLAGLPDNILCPYRAVLDKF